MPGEWADRLVRGPAKEFLSPEEFARLFDISPDTVDRMVRDGELPGPVQMTARTKVFTWRHVVFFLLRVELRPYFVEPTKAGGKKPPPTPDEGDSVA